MDKQQIGLLLSRVALRDHQAFEALYQLTSTRLYTIIYSVVKDEQIAADLLQEGFIKIWYNDHYCPIDYPWAWLCQSVRNLAIDAVRKRRRESEQTDELQHEPEITCIATDQRLNRCLQTLPEEKRNAIVLAYQHGMSHYEIVQHVKTPLGTIKSWIRRGLQELKRCLTE
ncbi:sigma-70 family RNA polymerase sigma factor [Vibrio anguillarum]|nr:sigma-70 family RNA polymerase sigma factor [Vibrio anguillarum]